MPLTMILNEHIQAPPGRVFAVLTDLDACSKWMPNFVRIEKLTKGSFSKGYAWRETRRMFGREASEVFEVVGVEPERVVELFVDGKKGSSKRGWYKFRYELHPQGQKTRLDLRGEIGGGGFLMATIGRLFSGAMKKAIAKDLRAMKAHIEGKSAEA